MSDSLQKEIIKIAIVTTSIIATITVCLLFNYFIVKQHREAEALREEQLLNKAIKLLEGKKN